MSQMRKLARSPLRHSLNLCVALLAFQLGVPAFAQQSPLELDPARTAVHFTLKTSLHTVHGMFQLKSGRVSFDPQSKKVSGLLVVDATSGDSGNKGRDSKMHREILESQKYPEITFAPLEVEGDVHPEGDSQVRVRGTFSLHGQDHEIVIPVALHNAGGEVTLDTDFSVLYLSWGLKNPSTFILRASDTVQLSIHAVGHWTGDRQTTGFRNFSSLSAGRLGE
jgi:polyisoprenoid-binding protein YceI